MAVEMTPEKARALLEGATPGEWRTGPLGRHVVSVDPGEMRIGSVNIGHIAIVDNVARAALLAAAPAALRAYLAEHARAERAEKDARDLSAELTRLREGARAHMRTLRVDGFCVGDAAVAHLDAFLAALEAGR